MSDQVTRPRCPVCNWELSDQDIAGGLCLSCGSNIVPKEAK